MSWDLKYAGGAPRLPYWVVPQGPGLDIQKLRNDHLKKGCWQVLVVPDYSHDVRRDLRYGLRYRGTLRLEWKGEGKNSALRASGDLYRDLDPEQVEEAGLRDGKEIPWFPHSEYRYYCRLEGLKSEPHSGMTWDLDVYRFSHSDNKWELDDKLKAELASIPRSDQRRQLEGVLRNPGGEVVANFKMAWLSNFFRRANVQMRRVERLRELSENFGTALAHMFEDADWKVSVDVEKEKLEEKTGAVWQSQDLHEAMLDARSKGSEEDWTYTLLSVRRTNRSRYGGFGVMFDAWAADSDNIPREGAAVACRARFELDKGKYDEWAGRVLEDCCYPQETKKKGKPIDEPIAYLRVAAHELGHAMGLAHNFAGTGYMQSLKNLAEMAEMENLDLPEMLQSNGAETSEGHGVYGNSGCKHFDDEDAQCLRHLPDGWVRPGGVEFLSDFAHEPIPVEDLTQDLTEKASDTPEDQSLELRVTPNEKVLMLGQPLRLTFGLFKKSGKDPIVVPGKIGLSSGRLAGTVGPDGGVERTFATVVRPFFDVKLKPLIRHGELTDEIKEKLRAAEKVIRSETLLRGDGGALLPSPGVYRIKAEVAWEIQGGGRKCVHGSSSVLVKEPDREPVKGPDQNTGECALEILSCEELMLPLVFHGDWSEEAAEVLQRALDDDSLGDHYAAIEARRLLSEAERQEDEDLLDKAIKFLRKGRRMAKGDIDALDRGINGLLTGSRKKTDNRVVNAALEELKIDGKTIDNSNIDAFKGLFQKTDVKNRSNQFTESLFEQAALCLAEGETTPVMTGSEIASLARAFLNAPDPVLTLQAVIKARDVLQGRKTELQEEKLISDDEVKEVEKLSNRIDAL